ncbi:Hint domain-containing protein [Shimia isoporae]|uniref:Hint domain-containing protein n=1 Tax=Shimia isoporae TaxID=647720 RepID=A0A4R1NPQ3_9RHOB|nr:Hint domain-containing protein [Shimia isoporae]TCL09829.1 Hint domain-containing protein [Shimia isoporae]
MTKSPYDNALPSQRLPVYPAEALVVSNGANLGDALSFSEELVPDDVYTLSARADEQSLSLRTDIDGAHFVAEDSSLGTPNARIFLDCVATFMPPSGDTIEVLVLVEVDDEGGVVEIFGAPLAPMTPKTDYVLVGYDRDTAAVRLAQLACVSFTAGTRITLATGEQKLIEDINVGDRVLTRDDGPQPVRWIGHSIHRATGEFAPIVITAGTLNNTDDLRVSPDHRLFIYQREDRLGVGRSELLIKARHLVNDTTVYAQEGGFVDYFQIMFDDHQIIFAEGISAETMQIDTRTQSVLPDEVKEQMRESGGEGRSAASQFEVHESLLKRPDAAALLKRASSK